MFKAYSLCFVNSSTFGNKTKLVFKLDLENKYNFDLFSEYQKRVIEHTKQQPFEHIYVDGILNGPRFVELSIKYKGSQKVEDLNVNDNVCCYLEFFEYDYKGSKGVSISTKQFIVVNQDQFKEHSGYQKEKQLEFSEFDVSSEF